MSVAPDGGRRLTTDELLDMLHRIARDPDAGPDAFRAAKLLLSLQNANVLLEEPLSESDMIERASRLMKPMGRDACQLAYHKAFSNSRVQRDNPSYIYEVPELKEGQLSDDDRALCKQAALSLRNMHRLIPELKRGGIHKGYPVGKGEAAQRAWRYRASVQALVYRKQMELKMQSQEGDGTVQEKDAS